MNLGTILMQAILSVSVLTSSPTMNAFEYRESDSNTIKTGEFKVDRGQFMLNDRPFVIKAAELHYPRIPREYWEHRIKMCKALGMNTICLYVFWNVHESEPDKFDFSGQNDVAGFIRMCADNDMKVILRPGPYVCAEWEMGGLPWWLLRNTDVRLRENDPYFIDRVSKFERALAEQVSSLTADKGGPIIMIQVENEYGSYGIDKDYISAIRDMLREYYGPNVTLFQCDWSSNFMNNGLEDLVWTLNFGTGADIDEQFSPLIEARPDSPLMCSEYWSGWFDKWGASHETRPAEEMVSGIRDMLDRNISFSLYMTHGGTNWGHWAGANSPGFSPDVTSYDYDAPINEQGAPTEKYYLLRDLLRHYHEGELDSVPDENQIMSIDRFALTEVAPLFENLPSAIYDSLPEPMELYGQGYGSIMYSTLLPRSVTCGEKLVIRDAHDYARIFVNGEFIGSLYRGNDDKELSLPSLEKGAKLEILIEAMGRINFGRAIKDYKGITESVLLSGDIGDTFENDTLRGWNVYLIPDKMDFYRGMSYEDVDSVKERYEGKYPCGVYRGEFNLDSVQDTFMNFETWGKGLVYVNGHPLGRIWNIGPQQTLYVPGVWLLKGQNEIMVFDILGPSEVTVEGLCTPIVDSLLETGEQFRSETSQEDISTYTLIAEGDLGDDASGWRKSMFPISYPVRYLCIEALEGVGDNEVASIAEIYLLDGSSKRIEREKWRVLSSDSEDVDAGNHGADKIFDLQESTYWQSERDKPYPHRIYLDLGEEHALSGIEYLPGVVRKSPTAIKKYRIYGK